MSAPMSLRPLLLALLLAPCVAWATEPPTTPADPTAPPAEPVPPAVDQARIGDNAVRGASGRIAVNQAAGIGNVQANLAAIALSPQGIGRAHAQARQQPASAADRSRTARVRIDGDAFAGSHGALAVNQVAGSGNAQANLFVVGQSPFGGASAAAVIAGLPGSAPTDIAPADDAALAAVAGEPTPESTDTIAPIRRARIADGAFRGSQGVVQVNQTAGVGNFSTNAIVLQLPGGTP